MAWPGTTLESPPVETQAIRLSLIVKVIPYVLAAFFFFWSLRQVGADNVVDTDAARHALNGAFVHDFVKDGQLLKPYEYGLHYYARLPGLSLPYHPPVFPVLEAVIYSVLGVSVFSARFAVALTVAISVFLLFRLIEVTQESTVVALAATASFCLWRLAQAVAGDVMLEYPAMMFSLAALWSIRDLSNGYRLGRGVWFAILAGAAVWTKQHAVFLGAVPFAWIVFSGSWRLLKEKTIWISSALFAAAVGALGLLAVPFQGAGINQVSPLEESGAIFINNLLYYRDCVRDSVGLWIPLAAIALVLTDWYARWTTRPRPVSNISFYWAWTCCSFAVLLLIGPYDIRYLFFVLPPVLVIIYTSLSSASERMLGPSKNWVMPAAAGMACCVLGLQIPAVFTHGPSEAAAMIVNGSSQVVFYCGSTDGNFMFSVRALDPKRKTAVITGEKLAPAALRPSAFDQLAHKYGISRIVLERSARPQACDALRLSPTPSMSLDREIPLASSNPRWRGSLMVYTFENPTRRTDGKLIVPVEKLGRDLVLDLN